MKLHGTDLIYFPNASILLPPVQVASEEHEGVLYVSLYALYKFNNLRAGRYVREKTEDERFIFPLHFLGQCFYAGTI